MEGGADATGPELDQMEVVIAGGMCGPVLENEELVNEIWKETGSTAQLKLLKVIKYAGEECIEDHRLLNEMSQTLLFTNRP